VDSLWVSGEEGALSDVVQIAIELYNSFQTEASSSVGGSAILERVNIVLECFNRDVEVLGSLGEHFWYVYSLGSRSDFLSSHEEVVRVGVSIISWVKHGVERSNCSWVPVEHVEISSVLFLDKLSQHFLILSAQVIEVSLDISCLFKQLDSFLEVELNDWRFADEVLKWILLPNYFKLGLVLILETVADEDKQLREHVQNLEVMLFDDHLHIEASKLAKMSICVAMLGSEHWSYLENSLEVSHKSHLLVELWALSEASILTKVLEGENVRSSLRSTSDHLWRMDFNKVILEHELSVKFANT
jgi:hypothetical protein